MKSLSLSFYFLLTITILNIAHINSNDFEDLENYDGYGFPDDENAISVVSISYELTYDENSVVKVTIKTYYELSQNIEFKAFLKTEDELHEHPLECSNEFIDSISCLTKKNIILDTQQKYYFYYDKNKSGSNITFDGEEIYEDDNRVSLVFSPEISEGQILYKDNKKFEVHNGNDMVSGGILYVTKKSKKVLQTPKSGFNKNIELNNFISHCGLAGYRPQSTLVAFKEAIRRGYKIVDADLVFSKDKIPVICHGTKLNEVSNGQGDLSEKTLEELEKLDFGSNFSEIYKGEKILKFEDLLKLCSDNDIILDLDLGHLTNKYFDDTNEYINIILGLIDKYEMINSIFINDYRSSIISKFKSIRSDIAFSISGMNEIENMDKLKDKYNNSKASIYNIGGLTTGKKINEEMVKHGLSLGKKIKASKIDDIEFANKVVSWGVNFICTNKLHPFLMKNEKEEPIIATCTQSDTEEDVSECEIDDEYNLTDNEYYSIYYSKNIYNLSEDIEETPIGEFKYVDTDVLDELYYEISHFDFKNGIIKLNTSNIIKKGEKIIGTVGPTYDNVAECYIYNFACDGKGTHMVDCTINKNDHDKVPYEGDYKIYSLEGYSLNSEQLYYKINYQKNMTRFKYTVLFVIIFVIILCIIIYIIRMRITGKYRHVQTNENGYITDDYLYR